MGGVSGSRGVGKSFSGSGSCRVVGEGGKGRGEKEEKEG